MAFAKIKTLLSRIFARERIKSILIFSAVILFVWFAIFGDQGLYYLHKAIKLKKDTKENIARLKQKIEELKKEKELLNDPKHLEFIIRQELGYVKQGEIVFQEMSP